jgi:hypothetical protein
VSGVSMTTRLEQALVALNRAHVRACLYRQGKVAELIDEARQLIETEIVAQRFEGLEVDLEGMIDDLAVDDRSQGFA